MARLSKRFFGVVLVVVVLILVGLGGLFRTDIGRTFVRDTAISLAETQGWDLSIGRLSGALPFEVKAEDIVVADGKGEFLRVGGADVLLDPAALIAGRLSFEVIVLERVFVTRAPEVPTASPAATPEPSTGTPLLPGIPITVRALSVSPLTLGPEIAGETVVLDINANTSVDAETGIDVGLKVTRLDGDGAIEGRLSSDAALSRLKTSIKGQSDQGGWVSRLLGLPGEPAIRVTLDGEGPVESFEARYGVSAGEGLETRGTISLGSLQPLAMTVAGSARATTFIPAKLRSDISGEATYRLGIAMDQDFSRLTVEGLKIDAPEVAVVGQFALDLRAGTLKADGSAELLKPSLARSFMPELDVGQVRLEINAAGPMLGPLINAEIFVGEPALAGNQALAITAKVAAQVTPTIGASLDGTVSVDVAGLRLSDAPEGSTGDRVSAGARFALADDVLKLSGIDVRTGPASIAGDASMNLVTSAATLSVDVSHDQLEHLAPPLRSGRLESTFHGEYDGTHAVVQVGGRLLDLRASDPNLAPVLSRPVEFWVSARQTSATGWDVSSLELTTGSIATSARGDVDLATLMGDLAASVRVGDLAVLDISETLTGGSASMTATARGSFEAAEIEWSLVTQDLRAHGLNFPRITGEGSLRTKSTTLAGPLSIEAETPVGRVRATTDLSFDGKVLALSEIEFRRAMDTIRGALAMTPEPLGVNGVLDVSVDSLKDWATLAELDLSGGLKTRVEASHVDGKQRLVVTAMLNDIAIAGEAPLTVKRIDGTATVEDALGTPMIDANAVVSDAAMDMALLDNLEVSAVGGMVDLRFDLKGSGAVDGKGLRVETAGTVAFVDGMGVGLDTLMIEGAEANLRLLQPTRATLAGDVAMLSPTSLSLFGGTLNLAGEMDRKGLRGKLEAENISLPPIARLAGTWLTSGVLNASGAISGPIVAPNGRFNLAMTDITGLGPPNTELPPMSLEITADLSDGALESSAAVSGIGEVPFEARLVTRVPGRDVVVPLEAKFTWRGGLSEIVAALPIDGNLIAGDAGIDLDFVGEFDTRDGTIKPARTSGLISLRNGRVENFISGAILDPLNVMVRLDGTRLVIERMEASDTTGGVLRVTGAVDLIEPTRPRVTLDAVMEAMTVARRDDAEVQLNAQLSLRSGQDRYAVSGEIVNHLTEIRLIGALPAEVVDLAVEEVRDGVAVTPEIAREKSSATGPPVDLDVEFSAPGRIFVRGRGLDSEWGGNIQVSGTAAAPRLAGSIGPVRGGFEFAGRRFELGEGGVSFSGGAEVEPELNISATHEATGFKALVAVTGTPSKPEIELSSDPSYPEDEILAKILFGKFTARLTATEALQLAQSTRTLLSGEPGTLDKIRGAIGVDVLTFAPGASESELGRLKAGKYVRDDLFVGVEQGTTAGSTRSIVEWYLTPKVTVEGTVGSGSESTLGIQRRWEY